MYHWKTLDEAYNFALDFTSIEGLQKKSYGPPKYQNSQFHDSQLGSPETK
jgi:hypothetical protein